MLEKAVNLEDGKKISRYANFMNTDISFSFCFFSISLLLCIFVMYLCDSVGCLEP